MSLYTVLLMTLRARCCQPLASILSAALLLDISFGMKAESEAVINAVDQVLKAGFRTGDIADAQTPKDKILGTDAMGEEVLKRI